MHYGTKTFFKVDGVINYQNIPCVLWKPNVHLRDHKSPTTVTILNPIEILHNNLNRLVIRCIYL